MATLQFIMPEKKEHPHPGSSYDRVRTMYPRCLSETSLTNVYYLAVFQPRQKKIIGRLNYNYGLLVPRGLCPTSVVKKSIDRVFFTPNTRERNPACKCRESTRAYIHLNRRVRCRSFLIDGSAGC